MLEVGVLYEAMSTGSTVYSMHTASCPGALKVDASILDKCLFQVTVDTRDGGF